MNAPALPADAALYYVANGYSTAGAELMGIQAASEGVLQALVRHGGITPLQALVENGGDGDAFRRQVAALDPKLPTGWIHLAQSARLAGIGSVLLPGPGLARFAWTRHRLGDHAWSLCGVTHTTATARVLDELASFAAAPVQPWDALICTSHAVHAMVRQVLDDQDAWLAQRLGASQAPRPLLPVIPLGIDCDEMAPDAAARLAWRAQLGIAPTDVAALYVGRFALHSKAHPVPLFQAMQLAAQQTRQRLVLVLAGWFAAGQSADLFHATAQAFCPDVTLVVVDGRRPEVRRHIRAAADLFVSPVDNIQETFGLTPVEAMAAALPVVVSDWDGYRDTVRDGIDGFRIATIAAPPGVHGEITDRFDDGQLDYDPFVAAIAQATAVDVGAMANAIARLAEDPDLRRRMGQAGLARARGQFDWAAVMPRYKALWQEQAALRAAAPMHDGQRRPARPDPSHAFAAWPSAVLGQQARIGRTARDAGDLARLLASPLIAHPGAAMPARRDLERLLARADGGPASALLTALGPGRGPDAMRALLWLAKYDLLVIQADWNDRRL
jgi:starch synthase